jgi:hypothetical protein
MRPLLSNDDDTAKCRRPIIVVIGEFDNLSVTLFARAAVSGFTCEIER